MFVWLRILLVAILLIVGIAVLKKCKLFQKKNIIVMLAIVLLIGTMVSFLPFENLFITFDSPEAAFQYMHIEKNEIKLVLEGETSAFVLGGNNRSGNCLIVEKATEGWCLSIGIDTKLIESRITDGYIINIYQYKASEDYYICVSAFQGHTLQIGDSLNSTFSEVNRGDSDADSYYEYYAYVEGLDAQYQVIVNDRVIYSHLEQ